MLNRIVFVQLVGAMVESRFNCSSSLHGVFLFVHILQPCIDVDLDTCLTCLCLCVSLADWLKTEDS